MRTFKDSARTVIQLLEQDATREAWRTLDDEELNDVKSIADHLLSSYRDERDRRGHQ